MGVSYRPDNPFAEQSGYRADNPFANPDKRSLKQRAAERQRINANEKDMAEAETPTYGTQALGGIAALLRDIPGGEAVQAGARSLVSPLLGRGKQSYGDALNDIRGAGADNPGSIVSRIAGAVPAIAAVPGAPALAGARYGIGSGLLQANPETVEGRLHDAAKEGTIGAIAGKAGEWIGSGVRALRAPSLGKKALERAAKMKEADGVAYGAAEAEGARLGPMPPVVNDALNAPDIKPYVDALRGSRTFANADDATLLREAYKLLSEHQGKLAGTMANATDFKAGTSLGAADTKLAKKQLLDAADAIMPSFRGAVAGHAQMAGEREAFRSGADAARRLGTPIAGKKLEKNSAEAFLASIAKMSPAEAKAAREGFLGRLSEQSTVTLNPLSMFGVPRTVKRINGAAKFIAALDKQAGQSPSLFPTAPVALGGLLDP